MVRSWPCLVVVVPMLAWGAPPDAGTPPSPSAPPPAAATPAAPDAIARFDALWPRRDDPGVLKQLDELQSTGLKANAEDFELLWRAARLKFWQADGAADDRLKKVLGREGWALGDRAIKLQPKRVEGLYYGGVSMGVYAQAIGVLKALRQGLEKQFNLRIDKAIELNPDLDAGGPLLAKGRYYYELPWPKRDLGQSKAWLEKALAAHPEALRGYLYLAETQLADGDAKQAAATIEKAFGPTDYDGPEGRRVHERAKATKAKIEKELR